MLSVRFTLYTITKDSTRPSRMFFLELGLVTDLCELLKFKLKNRRPYHQQSQEKVERSRDTWKEKLESDMKEENSKTIII